MANQVDRDGPRHVRTAPPQRDSGALAEGIIDRHLGVTSRVDLRARWGALHVCGTGTPSNSESRVERGFESGMSAEVVEQLAHLLAERAQFISVKFREPRQRSLA